MDFITRDVMMASAGAGSGIITTSGGAYNAVNFQSSQDLTNAPDTLELWLVDGSVAAQATTAIAAGNTSFSIAYEGVNANVFPATAPANGFVQISDLTNAVVVPWTGSTATSMTVGAIPALPAGANFGANATYVLASRHVIYTVSSSFFSSANSALQNTSMLSLQVNGAAAQPLAEGIEDMQVAYGFDDNQDGIVREDGTTSDEWLYNNAGDSAASHLITNLRAIRVTLVAKSTSVDSGAKFKGVPLYEDRNTVITSGDGFIRRVLRSEIAVRNFHQ
jgi:hypothetical protein